MKSKRIVTVKNVCEFYKKHRGRGMEFERSWPRIRLLMETLGSVPMAQLRRFDNPLDGVVVNLPKDSAGWKATTPTKELVFEMVDNSEAAWEAAQNKKRALG
jgi:hypothetical protein